MTYRQYRIEIVINLALVGLAVVGAVIWIGYPLWIFGGQIIHWLREGDWVPFSTRTMLTEFGLRVPEVEWQGVQKIINFIASLPAGVSRAELHGLQRQQ